MPSESYTPLSPSSWKKLSSITSQEQIPSGIPGCKHRIPLKDVYLVSTELVCFIAGILTVFWPRVAIALGQINQLVVIGFLLSVMAMCLEGQVLRTALMHTGSRRHATIQDLDALMRKDAFAAKLNLAYRLLLLLLIGVPLGLSVAYKKFAGGQSTITVHHGDGFFGFSSTPGRQRIGDGLSILADAYVPFWIDPGMNRTYGFNLYIADDNQTAVIVDSPFPSYLTGLQSSLGAEETLSLSTTVNATVSQMVNPTDEERSSDDFWTNVEQEFGHDFTVNGDNIRGANNALWAGMSGNFLTNFSVMYFSAWNTTRNETFWSEAIRTEQTRRLAKATWSISNSDITLTSATLIENSIQANQSLLQDNAIGLQEMFSNFLGEYDWHNRASAFDFPYPSLQNETLRFYQPVNTVPPLAAAMAWARITSLDTIDRPQGIQSTMLRSLTGYTKPVEEMVTIKTVPTLRRRPLLVLVLILNPVISIVCVLVKASLLYHSPLGDNFSTISLLAAASGTDLRVLRGATLTGDLDRKVGAGFIIEDGSLGWGNEKFSHISMFLGPSSQRGGKIKDGVCYE